MKTLLANLLLLTALATSMREQALGQQLFDREQLEVTQSSTFAPVFTASEILGAQRKNQQSCREACDACDSTCDSMSCTEAGQLPLWAATADALFLNRGTPSSNVLAFNTADPTQNLNTSNFNFGVHTGFDLSLLRYLDSDHALELRYFGVDHWRSEFSTPTTANNLLQINSAVPVFTFSGTGVDANYASALHNAEINGRRKINENWTLIAGFRYAELNERLSTSLVASAVPFSYDAAIRNRLYGFQLGGQARLLSRRKFSLDAFGKAGILGNAAAQSSTISTGVVTLRADGLSSRTAFMGETGATGTLQLLDRLAIRSGYRLLWLDGVAVASDQLAASDFASGVGFNGSGNVLYHGAFAGLELTY